MRPPPPLWLRPLLGVTGSLTAHLEREQPGPLPVTVLEAGWCRPGVEEAARLRLAAGRLAWVREVVLGADGGLRVYARTVAPAAALTGPLGRVPALGRRPLGHVLFAAADARRGPLELARLDGADLLARRMHRRGLPGTGLWARRSTLAVGGRRLLITEVFLPPDAGA